MRDFLYRSGRLAVAQVSLLAATVFLMARVALGGSVTQRDVEKMRARGRLYNSALGALDKEG